MADLGARWGAHGRAVPAANTDQSLTPTPLCQQGLLEAASLGSSCSHKPLPFPHQDFTSPLLLHRGVCVPFLSEQSDSEPVSWPKFLFHRGTRTVQWLIVVAHTTPRLTLHVPPLLWWLRRCWSAPGTAVWPRVLSGLLPLRFHPCKQPRAFHQTCSSGEGAPSLALLVSGEEETCCQF